MGQRTDDWRASGSFGQLPSGRDVSITQRDGFQPCTCETQDRTPELAKRFYDARQRRLRYFGTELLSEPAWDMLLDLMISKHSGKRVTTLGLCLAARTPDATGLRWIARLEGQGIVSRQHATDDRRVVLVEMTASGEQLLCAYLSGELAKTGS